MNVDQGLSRLRAFLAVADAGSFTQGARVIGLAQSTVSGGIASLEDQLKVQLFERRGKKVRLTPAGRTLAGPVRECIAAYVKAFDAVRDWTGTLGGTLSVGGSTIPGVYVLPAALARFHKKYPATLFSLQVADTGKILESLRQGELDLAVVGAKPTGHDLYSRAWGGDDLVLALPPHHPWKTRRSVRIQDIAGLPYVSRQPGSGQAQLAEDMLARAGVDLRKMQIVCRAGNTEAVLSAVRAGLGASLVSRLAVKTSGSGLSWVEVKGTNLHRHFWLCRRRGFSPPAAVRQLWNDLEQNDPRRMAAP